MKKDLDTDGVPLRGKRRGVGVSVSKKGGYGWREAIFFSEGRREGWSRDRFRRVDGVGDSLGEKWTERRTRQKKKDMPPGRIEEDAYGTRWGGERRR